jgi:hypothetical protein
MIPAGFGFEPAVPGQTRVTIGGHPATELRIGAHKGAAHVRRNPIIVYPLPIEHVTHTEVLLARIIYQNHDYRKSYLSVEREYVRTFGSLL